MMIVSVGRAHRIGASIALLALCACSGPDLAASSERSSSASSRIIGGTPDTEHLAVMALALGPADDTLSGVCTASVIHVDHGHAFLLTAAHCVVAQDESGATKLPIEPRALGSIQVTPGSSVQTDRARGNTYPASAVTIAPGYSGYAGNPEDIAILEVVGVPTDLPQLPVLRAEQDQLASGTEVTLVGYGITANPEEDDRAERRATTQSIAWLSSQFIGFDQRNGQGICSGDSGGPVLVTTVRGVAIAGINSVASADCGRGVSTRVSPFQDFIEQALSAKPVPATSRTDGDCSFNAARKFPAHDGAPLFAALLGACVVLTRRLTQSKKEK